MWPEDQGWEMDRLWRCWESLPKVLDCRELKPVDPTTIAQNTCCTSSGTVLQWRAHQRKWISRYRLVGVQLHEYIRQSPLLQA